jgi:hypothetical protein
VLDNGKRQEKVVAFRAVEYSSCNAEEMSDVILGATGEWYQIFGIMLDWITRSLMIQWL